jgi:hypothetical protein
MHAAVWQAGRLARVKAGRAVDPSRQQLWINFWGRSHGRMTGAAAPNCDPGVSASHPAVCGAWRGCAFAGGRHLPTQGCCRRTAPPWLLHLQPSR